MSSPCRSAAGIIGSCIRLAMRRRGGRAWGSMLWRQLNRSLGAKPSRILGPGNRWQYKPNVTAPDGRSLAQSGHLGSTKPCPLSGVKRTWRLHCEMSASDPKRTIICRQRCLSRLPGCAMASLCLFGRRTVVGQPDSSSARYAIERPTARFMNIARVCWKPSTHGETAIHRPTIQAIDLPSPGTL